MKILFLTDNFPPEVNAPATRTYEHCREWVKQGADVTIITCAPNFPRGKVYEGYKNKWYQEEMMDGIRVIRVWTYIAENKGTLKRMLDYYSFYLSAVRAGRKQECDLIIGTSPQFFTAVAAMKLAKIKRKPWVMEVRDIWPESIKAVDAVKDGTVIHYLEKKEAQCYKTAQKIICVTQGIHERLARRGIPEEKLYTFTNGANLERYSQRPINSDLVEKLHLEGKKIVGYVGTMGMAHKLDFIISAAKKVEQSNIHFLFIGEGAEKENLKKLITDLDCSNVTILDSIGKSEVPEYLSILHIALVNLKKTDLFLGALPSKIFENAAMGKPILLGLKGEAERVIDHYNAGISFEPENEDDFLEKLHKLADDKEFYDLCVTGCHNLAHDYDRKRISQAMLNTIASIKKDR